MEASKVPASLRRWAHMIEDIEDHRASGPWGDGYLVHLKPGFIDVSTEAHSVQEDNITKAAQRFRDFVQPCACDSCERAVAPRKTISPHQVLKRAIFFFTAIKHGDIDEHTSPEVREMMIKTSHELADLEGMEEAGKILTDLAQHNMPPKTNMLADAIESVGEFLHDLDAPSMRERRQAMEQGSLFA